MNSLKVYKVHLLFKDNEKILYKEVTVDYYSYVVQFKLDVLKHFLNKEFDLEIVSIKKLDPEVQKAFVSFLESKVLFSEEEYDDYFRLKDMKQYSLYETKIFLNDLTKKEVCLFYEKCKAELLNKKVKPSDLGIKIRKLNLKEKYLQKYPIQVKLADYIPILTKPSYKTTPSFEKLKYMSKSELECLYRFEISNHFGKLQFLDFVDLTFCNLDLWIRINKQKLEIFPDEVFPKNKKKPQKGQKLNCKCLVTFFDVNFDALSSLKTVKTPSKKTVSNDFAFRKYSNLKKSNLPNYLDISREERLMLSKEKRTQSFKFFSSTKKKNVELDSVSAFNLRSNKKYLTSEKKHVPLSRYLDTPDYHTSSGSEFNIEKENLKNRNVIRNEKDFVNSLKIKAKKMGGFHQNWNFLTGEWEILFLKF